MMRADISASDGVSTADLVQAHGLALALIGAVLEGGGVAAKGEFSRLLGVLATVTAETDKRQGDILGVWSAMTQSLR